MSASGATRMVPAHAATPSGGGMGATENVNVLGLQRHLRRHVRGEVRFDDGSLAMYANDASNYRQVPIGVVIPRTLDDVVETMRACHAYRAPVVCRGGGTSLSGETVNVAVVIDFSKYLTGVGEVDMHDGSAPTVLAETGVINEELNKTIGHTGYVFGPDPSSHSRCTIGGNIGNNSCGVHSVQSHLYGPGPRTSDNTERLEVVTYDGERFWVGADEEGRLDAIIDAGGAKGRIYAQLRDLRDRYADDIRAGFPSVDEMPRRVSGYNLDELLPENGFNVARALVGTESTCAVALQAELTLTPAMLHRTLVVVQYPSVAAAGEHVMQILDWKPIGLEAVDHLLVHDQQVVGQNLSGLQDLPRREDGCAWLMVQFGADDPAESEDTAHRFIDWLRTELHYDADRMVLSRSVQDGGNSEELWAIREAGLGSTAFPPDGRDHWPGWEDSAVPPRCVGDYVRDLQELYARHGLRGAMYGHFAEGCIHSRISFDLRHADGLRNYRAFMEQAGDLVASYGGSMSGEHGDGQQRAELLDKQYGPRLMQAMHEFKAIWDPQWKLNPGKVIDPYLMDENLKLGTDYNPHRPETVFAYESDDGDFAHATLRCVGVGECRVPDAESGNTMCPSYQVTREEKHSTRGRARLLFEMLRGETIKDGWQSREVAESLDLCLSCKGCTTDCPVQVDIPTYKAEFRYHHYKSLRRWRPRSAYAFGFIDQAARLASRMPELTNFVTGTPGLSRLTKFAGGIDRRRDLPAFAPMTLQQWFTRRGGTTNPDGPRVLVFPDTFTNHLHTAVGRACIEAVEAAGYQVVMPSGHVCCGRPLYDFGFLDAAQRYLHHVIDQVRDDVRAGTPVIGMEPSCVAVFKEEMPKILPHDDDAERLRRNVYHFPEFFTEFDVEPPRLDGDVQLWTHCHQRATGGPSAEQTVLERMGLQVEALSGGCCGLAGSWGFEDGRYGISMDCGEQALLPAVRKADDGTLLVADGFSCRTQVDQAGVGAEPLHLSQLMALARQRTEPRGGSTGGRPPGRPQPAMLRRVARTAGPVAGAAAAAAAGVALRLRR